MAVEGGSCRSSVGPVPGQPGFVVETQEQAAQLAAQILQKSGVSQEMISPGNAKFLAHQILADHVIESHRLEVGRLQQELTRVNGELKTVQRASLSPSEKRKNWSPIPSPPPPPPPPPMNTLSHYDVVAAPPCTESMARPDSVLPNANQPNQSMQHTQPPLQPIQSQPSQGGGKVLSESELVNHIIAVLRGQQQQQPSLSRKSSRSSRGGMAQPTPNTQPLTAPINFTDLAAATVRSAEGKGVDAWDLPHCKLPPIQQPTDLQALVLQSLAAGQSNPQDVTNRTSTSTTIPPPPFSSTHHIGDDVDWPALSSDIMRIVRELSLRQQDMMIQNEEMEMMLRTNIRGVDDDVFETPVDQLQGGLLQAAEPALPAAPAVQMPPQRFQSAQSDGPRQAPSIPSSTSNKGAGCYINTIDVESQAVDMDQQDWTLGNYGVSASSGGLRTTPINSDPYLAERRASGSTACSVVQGNLADPNGFPLPANPVSKGSSKASQPQPRQPSSTTAAVVDPTNQLPEGWKCYHTPEGRPYYFNTATGKSHWKKPLASAGKPLLINININVDKKKGATPAASREPTPATEGNLIREAPSPSIPGSGGSPPVDQPPSLPVEVEVVDNHSRSVVDVHVSDRKAESIVQDSPIQPTPGGDSVIIEEVVNEVKTSSVHHSISHPPSEPQPQLSVPASVPAAAPTPGATPAAAPMSTPGVAPVSTPPGIGGGEVLVEPLVTPSSGQFRELPPDRAGSPIIVPPVNSITTVIVEGVPGSPPRVAVRGSSITPGSPIHVAAV
eukprot:TRINITY_DN4083_c3_g1_i1.p1 TRINITY_DN4083_c3_g1~~TRINITY_DN4083_c3_g1_i1.p1  ORF type:complete len:781 (+),score=160.34 TRINITY_DN4083_c3_g1_i1:31-2373(+)